MMSNGVPHRRHDDALAAVRKHLSCRTADSPAPAPGSAAAACRCITWELCGDGGVAI